MTNITQFGKKAADRLATATNNGLLAVADYVKLAAMPAWQVADKTTLDRLAAPPVVRVSRGAALNITNVGAGTPITWDTVTFDTHGMWGGGAPTRLTAPVGWAGYYSVRAGIRYLNAAGGRRSLWFQNQAGTAFAWEDDVADAGGLDQTSLVLADLVFLNAGDWIDVRGFQNFAANLAVIPGNSVFCAMQWERS